MNDPSRRSSEISFPTAISKYEPTRLNRKTYRELDMDWTCIRGDVSVLFVRSSARLVAFYARCSEVGEEKLRVCPPNVLFVEHKISPVGGTSISVRKLLLWNYSPLRDQELIVRTVSH
jgi:hypothetical protein